MKKLLILCGVLCVWSLPASATSYYWSGSVTGGGGVSCTNGTFKWDADSGVAGAAHKCWATASNGTTASAAIPGASDAVFFDASSGSSSILVNAPNNASGAAMVSIGGLTLTGFTGGLDFTNGGATTNNVTDTGVLNSTGSAAQTLNMGNGTWTFTAAAGLVTLSNTGLTCTCSSAAMVWNVTATAATSAGITFGAVALTLGTITVTYTGAGPFLIVGGTPVSTLGNVVINGPVALEGAQGKTVNFGGSLTMNGSPSAGSWQAILDNTSNGQNTWHFNTNNNSGTLNGVIINRQAFTCGSGGAITATNSIDLGGNTFTTCTNGITAPAGGSVGIIGGS